MFIRVEVGRLGGYVVNNAGEVLSSSLLALSWPGDRCPRKAVDLVRPGPQGPKVPMAPKTSSKQPSISCQIGCPLKRTLCTSGLIVLQLYLIV